MSDSDMTSRDIGEELERMDLLLGTDPYKIIEWENLQNLTNKAMKEIDPSGELSISEAVALMSIKRAKKLLKDVKDAINWSYAINIASSLNKHKDAEGITGLINRIPNDLMSLVFRAYIFHYGHYAKKEKN